MMPLRKGQILSIPYRDGSLMRVIVIDPNGQGEGRPTLGMGFGMTSENLGLPKSTLSDWTTDTEEGVRQTKANTLEPRETEALEGVRQTEANTPVKLLRSPSGRFYSVLSVLDETGNIQSVIEGCDWVDLACDVSDTPKRVKKATVEKLNAFIRWVAKKGFYATVYAQILGSYTRDDDNALSEAIELLEQANQLLIEENQKLQQENYELVCENALLEHRNDRQNYIVDELKRDMHWHRMNSWDSTP